MPALFECFAQRLAVVDHLVGAQRLHPALGLRARSGADHAQPRELFGQLREDRADATGRTDDQQALAFIGFAFAHLQALEEQLPRGNGRQRQGSGFGETEGFRHMADDSLIHHVQLAVTPGAGDGAGVEHLVACLEQCHFTANGLDHAGHVPTQHFGRAGFRLDVLTDLGVHRVDRDGFDFHQQVSRTSDRLRQFDVLQGVVRR